MQEYPKWIAVSGPGHPQNPGKVLVENEDQEREALATGEGPAELNPPMDEKRSEAAQLAPVAALLADGAPTKEIKDQDRGELIATLSVLIMTSTLSDDEIREQVDAFKRWEEARQGGDYDDLADRLAGGDDRRTVDDMSEREPLKDAAGDEVAPPQDQEANKDQLGAGERTLNEAESAPGNGDGAGAPEDREAGTHPATDATKQALTDPDETKPPEEGGAKTTGKPKAAKK